jgi:hypothetical protein
LASNPPTSPVLLCLGNAFFADLWVANENFIACLLACLLAPRGFSAFVVQIRRIHKTKPHRDFTENMMLLILIEGRESSNRRKTKTLTKFH